MAPLPDVLVIYDNYTPDAFENTGAITQMHDVPRVTGTIDVSALIAGSPEERHEYLMGLIIYTACTFAVFVIWALVIILLKCCGTKRVGVFSGHPPQKPAPPPGYESAAVREYKKELKLEEENPIDYTEAATCVHLSDNEIVDDSGNENDEQKEEMGTENSDSPTVKHRNNYEDVERSGSSAQENTNSDSAVDEDTKLDETNSNEPPLDEAVAAYECQVKRVDRQILWTRIIVIISGIAVIGASIFFINEGMNKLGKTLDAAIDGTEQIKGLTENAIVIIDAFQEGGANRTDAIAELNLTISTSGWCPVKRKELIEACIEEIVIENFTIAGFNVTNCTITGLPFQEELKTLLEFLNSTATNVRKEIDAIKSDLYEVQDMIDWLIPKARSFSWTLYVSSAFAVLVDIVVLIILYSVYLAWRQRLNKPFVCVRSWLIIPFAHFLVFMMWLFAIIFCFSAVLSADFCYDGPDSRLLLVLDHFEDSFSSQTFALITYYLTGCVGPPVGLLQTDTASSVGRVIDVVHNLTFAISGIDQSAYNETCGVDISPLTFVAEIVHSELHIVADTVAGVQRLFLCSTFFPVHKRIFYDAVCYLGAGALRNIYISLLVTVCSSLAFITFRAAWQEDVDPKEEESGEAKQSWCASLFGCYSKTARGGEDEGPVSEVEDSAPKDNASEDSAIVDPPGEDTADVGTYSGVSSTLRTIYLTLINTLFFTWVASLFVQHLRA